MNNQLINYKQARGELCGTCVWRPFACGVCSMRKANGHACDSMPVKCCRRVFYSMMNCSDALQFLPVATAMYTPLASSAVATALPLLSLTFLPSME